ncbi:apolipoprotein N-acyltransferase [Taylorella equigenitalis]|uniref:Apolipoprotein N-acyltransferase n=2 Tax=Taylorella equigenitalis TaxID=29575 RepID=A0A654KFV3_TAYEM|nr:apolipoprotein N-acyltransferase [Taylorella equigenitalis]ADU91318.1 Apolipoprotein N-acyltransferase [Taylorella equigenitalis MCE9]AFN36413.1 putative apolipoprotein N-acyltransferase [Taylorella equigenitalis ATCC 35865]ASY39815.1 apolipoprotein N-acyltransferase [Taylorella equigenitalis]WDU56134.1 apolipoprotein N-acyltransferase [Taylorella equigenitalis]VEG32392.1 Apolipoprotein N-acyltransferase [Taylorella equigenitalis ATCC 35865]
MKFLILFFLGALHAQSFSAGIIPEFALAPLQLITFTIATILIFYGTSKTYLKAFTFGLAHFAFGLYWIYNSVHGFGYIHPIISWSIVLAFAAFLALFPVLAIFIFRKVQGLNFVGFKAPIIFSASWTAAELLRGYLLTGFPWLNLAYAHAQSPIGAWAPVLGSYGMTFMATLLSGFVSLWVLRKNIRKEVRFAQFGIIAILVSCIGLKSIDWSKPYGGLTSIRLVQSNIVQDLKYNPLKLNTILDRNIELAMLPAGDSNQPPELVLFSETILPSTQRSIPLSFWTRILTLAHQNEAQFILGINHETDSQTTENQLDYPYDLHNTLLLINKDTDVNSLYDTSVHNNLIKYDKKHLVPFGEMVPSYVRWFVNLIGLPFIDFKSGSDRQNNFSINGQYVAPNICYEDIFGSELLPSLFSHEGNPGATILYNASNLMWFGNSSALGQHLEMSKVRARETSRPIVRATNTGATAHISHEGKVLASLPYETTGVLDVLVQGRTGLTLYARISDWGILVLVLGILLIGLLYRKTTNEK